MPIKKIRSITLEAVQSSLVRKFGAVLLENVVRYILRARFSYRLGGIQYKRV